MASSTEYGYKLYIGSADIWAGSPMFLESLNLYVEIKLEGSAVQCTNVIEQNKAPAWNEEFRLFGKTSSIISLFIKHKILGEDTCIGRVDVPTNILLSQCADNKFATFEVIPDSVGNNKSSAGNITVKFSWLIDAGDSVPEELAHDLFERGSSQLWEYHDLKELEVSMSDLQKSVQFTEDGHPKKPLYLHELGVSHHKRYQRLDKQTDVENAIRHLKKACQLAEDGHPEKLRFLSNLGVGQRCRFECLGELTDLQDSISNLEKSVQLTNDKHASKPEYLSNLGASQMRRFECLGELNDINESISNLQKSVQLADDRHPNKTTYLMNLGNTQRLRFEHLGELTDVEHSISNLQQSVQLTRDMDPNKPMHLSNLGLSWMRRFERLGELTDINESILNLQKSVQLADDGHPSKTMYLGNLGSAQRNRFERLGELKDVEDSISNLQKSVQLTKDKDPNKPVHVGNLGTSQMRRFQHLGELDDLNESISNMQKSVQLIDDGHPNNKMYLCILGIAQRIRFQRLGELTDVEDSVSNLQKSIQLTEDVHLYKPRILGNLGASQLDRYVRLMELTDLEKAISNTQQSVNMVDDAHPDKPLFLTSLSKCQGRRFDHLHDPTDLEDSISNLQQAVQLTEDTHPDKQKYLDDLGNAQRRRYESFGELKDVEDSISNIQKAINLTNDGHPDKPHQLGGLSVSQLRLFDHLGGLTNLENAVSNLQKSIELIEDDHPYKGFNLFRLGTVLGRRFKLLGETADLTAAVAAFQKSAQLNSTSLFFALSSARACAELTHRNGDLSSALHGYRTALEIMPKVAWLGLSRSSHHFLLSEFDFEDLGCLSATCAIQLGRFEEAVELLDLGRSVFWQQASSLRPDLETLKEVAPELANQLERVGQKLDASNFGNVGLGGLEEAGDACHRLVGEWEGLVERIRELPEFKYFLRPIPFRQLRQASAGGQVAIINISKYGVDALIFGCTGPIEHVPLPKINLQKLTELAGNVMLSRSADSRATEDDRATYQRNTTTNHLRNILKIIWNTILVPIFDAIQVPTKSTADLPHRRIWWYLTGPLTFIPIHAAGPDKGDTDVSRVVISSYVTTLNGLLQAQKANAPVSTRQRKLLAVSQPNTPGQSSIPQSTQEVLRVVEAAHSAGWIQEDIVVLDGVDATVKRVLDALDKCSWVHFACHGSQDPETGTKSAFALEDGGLELGQIASKRLTGQFAFLSACHAASGLKELPGEAMHLAAGLQFAGFTSVIATMWGISDEDAPKVADHVYRYLFQNGVEGLDPSEAATAINRAVHSLREDSSVTLERWAPFIHFGI